MIGCLRGIDPRPLLVARSSSMPPRWVLLKANLPTFKQYLLKSLTTIGISWTIIYIYIIYKIMKVVISWGIRFIMLHGLCSSPARVQNPVTRNHLQCFPEPGICSSTPFEIWLMHPTHRPTHQACLEHLSLEKNHEKSHPTPFQVSSEILWYPLIHPLIHGAGSSWFIVAGWIIPLCGPTLIGHQPQDIFLAIKHLSRPC